MKQRSMHILPLLLACLLLSSCELMTTEPRIGTMRMISVGIDYCNTTDLGSKNFLHGTVGDALAMGEAFDIMFRTSKNRIVSSDAITTMVQKGETLPTSTDTTYPSKTNILTKMKTIATTAQTNDLFVFYYSGHGAYPTGDLICATPNSNGKMYGPNDRLLPEVILSVSELLKAVSEIPGKKVLIFDSCHSGQYIQDTGSMVDTEEAGLDSITTAIQNLFSSYDTSIQDDMFILAGSRASESSWEPGKPGGHGNFTSGLLSAMGMYTEFTQGTGAYAGYKEYISRSCRQVRTAPAGTQSVLTFDGLFSYAKSRTASSLRYPQHPQAIRGLYDLVLFRY